MKRHRLDAFSLFFGLLFLLFGIPFLFGAADVSSIHAPGLWPLPLIALGVLVALVAISASRRDDVPAETRERSDSVDHQA
jgi:hypothetical protein